ncbi:hypothetical protein Tco_1094910, partial [Tanacetum coccineum]
MSRGGGRGEDRSGGDEMKGGGSVEMTVRLLLWCAGCGGKGGGVVVTRCFDDLGGGGWPESDRNLVGARVMAPKKKDGKEEIISV